MCWRLRFFVAWGGSCRTVHEKWRICLHSFVCCPTLKPQRSVMKPKKTFVLCSFASKMFDWSEDVVSSSFGTVNSHVPYILSNKIMCKDMSRSLQFPTLVRSMFYSLIISMSLFTWIYIPYPHTSHGLSVLDSVSQHGDGRPPCKARFPGGLSCGDSYDHPYGSPCCHNLSNKWPLSSKDSSCMYLCNKSPDHLIVVCMKQRDAGNLHCLGRQSSTCPTCPLLFAYCSIFLLGSFFWWWISPKCWCWGSSSKLVPGRVGILKDI